MCSLLRIASHDMGSARRNHALQPLQRPSHSQTQMTGTCCEPATLNLRRAWIPASNTSPVALALLSTVDMRHISLLLKLERGRSVLYVLALLLINYCRNIFVTLLALSDPLLAQYISFRIFYLKVHGTLNSLG